MMRIVRTRTKMELLSRPSSSDASLDSMPRHGSQADVVTALAEPGILFSKAKLNILEL